MRRALAVVSETSRSALPNSLSSTRRVLRPRSGSARQKALFYVAAGRARSPRAASSFVALLAERRRLSDSALSRSRLCCFASAD